MRDRPPPPQERGVVALLGVLVGGALRVECHPAVLTSLLRCVGAAATAIPFWHPAAPRAAEAALAPLDGGGHRVVALENAGPLIARTRQHKSQIRRAQPIINNLLKNSRERLC